MKKSDKLKLEKLLREEISSIETRLKNMEIEPSSISGDMGDMSADLAMEHTQIALREKIVKRLYDLKTALQRIDDDSFGICEDTGEPIDIKRLMLVPSTRLSTAAAQKRERRR